MKTLLVITSLAEVITIWVCERKFNESGSRLLDTKPTVHKQMQPTTAYKATTTNITVVHSKRHSLSWTQYSFLRSCLSSTIFSQENSFFHPKSFLPWASSAWAAYYWERKYFCSRVGIILSWIINILPGYYVSASLSFFGILLPHADWIT